MEFVTDCLPDQTILLPLITGGLEKIKGRGFSVLGLLSHRMTTFLENFMVNHLDVILSHTEYGHHFHLGGGITISTSPTQRVQSFVECEGSPYRFIVVGELTSFKIVEDAVRVRIYF